MLLHFLSLLALILLVSLIVSFICSLGTETVKTVITTETTVVNTTQTKREQIDPVAFTMTNVPVFEKNENVNDRFYYSLTADERVEFDKAFITREYGELSRLPKYRIGENNGEWFSNIYIYIFRFRNYLSKSLIDKIYEYKR